MKVFTWAMRIGRVNISYKDLTRSLYVMGASGTGKSKALISWIVQLMHAVNLCVIDPAGDLYHETIARIAADRRSQRSRRGMPSVWERLLLINPIGFHTATINPLEPLEGIPPERQAQFLATIVTKMFRMDELITARMQRMQLMTFWLLIECQLTLLEFVPVLTMRDLRKRLIATLPEMHQVRLYFEREFPTTDRLITEWTQSSLNKIGALTADPALRLLFGSRKSTINFSSILNESVVLVNLNKGQLPEKLTHLAGVFIVGMLQLAAYARAAKPYSPRRNFAIILDEFHNFVTEDIHTILSETRKYKFSAILANQFWGQLEDQPELQNAIKNTVGGYCLFQIGMDDAQVFVRDIFAPDLKKQIKHTQILPANWGNEIVEPYESITWYTLEETFHRYARLLSHQQPDRMFWYKKRGPHPPVRLRSSTLADIRMTPRLEAAIAELTALSYAKYARRKTDIEAEIEERWRELFADEPPGNTSSSVPPFVER